MAILTGILTNVALDKLNTFKVKAKAEAFIQIDSLRQLESLSGEIKSFEERFVLGGGSNLLFVGDYAGLVIFPQLKGIQLVFENEEKVTLKVAASEVWHDFVCYCLERDYFGLENLALIPGTVGAAPVQNIGAYGVEAESFISAVECFDLQEGETLTLSHAECQFAYRDSFIKRAGQGRYLVTNVTFELFKKAAPVLSYKPLHDYFSDVDSASPQQVFERVCQIRSEKLPDPKVLANAGSFFKNPIISEEQYRCLMQEFPGLVAFPTTENTYKVAAGWLIEKAGFKGQTIGKIGVHKHQALVLVNYSDRSGSNILALAHTIMQTVERMFAISLEPEVRIVGNNNTFAESATL